MDTQNIVYQARVNVDSSGLKAAKKEAERLRSELEALTPATEQFNQALKNLQDANKRVAKESQQSTKAAAESQQAYKDFADTVATAAKDGDVANEKLKKSAEDASKVISRSFDRTNATLGELQQRQKELKNARLEVPLDSAAFASATKQLGEITGEIKTYQKEVGQIAKGTRDATEVINEEFTAVGKSLSDLIQRQKDLKKARLDVPIDSDEYARASKELRILNDGIKEFRKEGREAVKPAEQFNKAIEDSDKVLKASSRSINDIEGALKSVRKAIKNVATDSKEFEELAARSEELQEQLQNAREAGNESTGAFGRLTRAFDGLNTTLKASIIGFIVGVLVELIQNSRALEPVLNTVSDLFAVLNKALKPVLDALTKILVPILEALFPLLEVLSIPLQLLADGLQLITPLFEALGDVIGAVLSPLKSLGEALGSTFSSDEVVELNKRTRELETNLARAEAAAEKLRGEREALLTVAESEGVAEEKRLELFQRAARLAERESRTRIDAARERVELLRDDIRLNGESQEKLQELAEAEQELATQRADANALQADIQGKILDNAVAIAESETLTLAEKLKQIDASFKQVSLQEEQRLKTLEQKKAEVDLTEELIRQNETRLRGLGIFDQALAEVDKRRAEAVEDIEEQTIKIEALEKRRIQTIDTARQASFDRFAEGLQENVELQNQLAEQQIRAQQRVAEDERRALSERVAALREAERIQLEIILRTADAEIQLAEGNEQRIKVIRARVKEDLQDLREESREAIQEIQGNIDSVNNSPALTLEFDAEGAVKQAQNIVAELKPIGKEVSGIEGQFAGLKKNFRELLSEGGFVGVAQAAVDGIQATFDAVVQPLAEIFDQLDERRKEQLEKQKQAAEERIAIEQEAIAEIEQLSQTAVGEELVRLNREKKQREEVVEAETAAREKADKEQKQIEIRQAKRQKALDIIQATISTAQAVIKAFAQLGPIAGAVAAGVVGAVGAAQIATIASQPIPEARRGAKLSDWEDVPTYAAGGPVSPAGGISRGAPHSRGGIKLVDSGSGRVRGEIEGNEVVLTSGVARNPTLLAAASRINQAAGGIPFFQGGGIIPSEVSTVDTETVVNSVGSDAVISELKSINENLKERGTLSIEEFEDVKNRRDGNRNRTTIVG